MRKRKMILLFFMLFVTVLCVFLGRKTRFDNQICLTQLAGEGEGYILETSEHHLILIDGGTHEDAQRLRQILQEKGNPTIVAWFLTSIENERSGALCEILEEHPEVKIEKIFVSLNHEGYQNCELAKEEMREIEENLAILYADEHKEKLQEMQRRQAYSFDNYFVTPLEIKPQGEIAENDIANHTVILKVDNIFKSIIFLGNSGDEKARLFLENNQDERKCDVLEFSKNQSNQMAQEIFEALRPKKVMTPAANQSSFVHDQEVFTKAQGEATLVIW